MSPLQHFYDWLATLNWGSVPDWFAAVGTIGAVAVALYLAEKGARDQRGREREAQASCISSWHQPGREDVVISNPSSSAIYNVAISFGVSYGEGEPFQQGNEFNVFLRALPAGESRIHEPPTPPELVGRELAVSVTFKDAQGVHWRRDATGKLYETAEQSNYSGLNVTHPVIFSTFRNARMNV